MVRDTIAVGIGLLAAAVAAIIFTVTGHPAIPAGGGWLALEMIGTAAVGFLAYILMATPDPFEVGRNS